MSRTGGHGYGQDPLLRISEDGAYHGLGTVTCSGSRNPWLSPMELVEEVDAHQRRWRFTIARATATTCQLLQFLPPLIIVACAVQLQTMPEVFGHKRALPSKDSLVTSKPHVVLATQADSGEDNGVSPN